MRIVASSRATSASVGRWGRVKPESAIGRLGKDAVERERVGVDVELEPRAEALDHRDAAALAGAESPPPGAAAIPAEHGAYEDPEHGAAERPSLRYVFAIAPASAARLMTNVGAFHTSI
jgi:hypothetical protein